MKNYLFALLTALILLFPAAGRAQGLNFTFTAPNQSGPAGAMLAYSGTLINTSGSTLFLTFDSLSLSPATVATADDSPFFNTETLAYLNGTPVAIANGGSLTLPVFNATVTPGASGGSVASGIFSIQADTSSDPNNPGTSFTTPDTAFSVTISATAAPEPSGLTAPALFALGLSAFALCARRRRGAFR